LYKSTVNKRAHLALGSLGRGGFFGANDLLAFAPLLFFAFRLHHFPQLFLLLARLFNLVLPLL
jgi:hypothetical protein